jgi:radical SAM protein with 4Fe4S-binding SPASM domain
MSICMLSHRDSFDLRTGTLEEGWRHFLGAVRDRKISRETKCTNCHLKSVCGMCPANAALESGDPETPVDFLCHVAHLRALTMEWPIHPHGECDFCEGGARYEEVSREGRSLRAVPVLPAIRAAGKPEYCETSSICLMGGSDGM